MANRKIRNALTLPGQVKVWAFNVWGDVYTVGEAGSAHELRDLVTIANERNGGCGATIAGIASALGGCGLIERCGQWTTPQGWPPAVVNEIGRGI